MPVNDSAKLAATVLLAAAVAALCQGCGTSKNDGQAANRPPEISGLAIHPEQPSVDAQLTLEVEGSDPDGDLVFYRVEWTVNGQVKESGSAQQFSTRGLSPGDQVAARVQAFDGQVQGDWVASATAVLWPKLAGIDSLSLEPSPLAEGLTSIKAVPRLSAPEMPEGMRIVYGWTLDGRALRDSGPSVATEPLRRGQRLEVQATPVLGEARGRTFRAAMTVLGAPPVVSGIEYVGQDGTNYEYRVNATDPGAEPLTFSLTSAPPGVRVDPRTGTVTIPRGETAGGIMVRVSNRSGSWVERRVEATP